MKSFTMFSDTGCHSRHGDNLILAGISRLLNSCLPFAVTFFIVTIVVFSPQSHPVGTLAHVRKEIGKQFPSIANSDSSAAVIFPLFVSRISASHNHLRPNLKNGSHLSSAGMAMLKKSFVIGDLSGSFLDRHSIAFSMLCLAADGRLEPTSAANLTSFGRKTT